MRVNNGADMQADEIGGGSSLGVAGAYTGSSATGLTGATGLVTNAHVGKMLVVGGVYGVILSNTTTAFVVDQWYTPGLVSTAAAATPAGTGTYAVLPGRAPAIFMALTTDTADPVATDTALTGEVVAAGSGCVRKLAAYAHTTGAAGYTMTATFTYTSVDNSFGSRAIAKIGMFNSVLPATGIMQYETKLSTPATLTATADALTNTQSVVM